MPFRRLRLLGGYLAVLLVVTAVTHLPQFRSVEMHWLDAQFSLLRTLGRVVANDDVRIVGIDDEDLRTFGVPIALLHRQMGDFLLAMSAARPQAVGFDVVLPPRSFDSLQPGLDAALARGIMMARRSAPLVLGLATEPDGKVRPLHPLFASLATPQGIGLVLVSNDADGTVRRFDERLGDGDTSIPTLVGQLARALGVKVTAGTINPLVGDPFAYVPLRDVLTWQAAGDTAALQRRFAGKIVLLGGVLAYDDLHRTSIPLATWTDDAARSHGVLIHGQVLRSLLTSSMLQSAPLALSLVLSGFLALTWFLRPGIPAALLVAVISGSILALGAWAISRGWIFPAMGLVAPTMAGFACRALMESYRTALERRRLRATFDGFVSPGVLNEILAGRLVPALGGKRHELCVLFSDIRGFTTLSEKMSPEVVTDLLNRYFERMATAIHEHGGTLDKFIGDGIMAFFGAPQAMDNPCSAAFAAARDMVAALDSFNAEQTARGAPGIAIGIGLHFGPAIVGYVGSRERHEYSAIGDTVNTASRIEGLTKEAGVPLLLSRSVCEQLADRAGLIEIGYMPVKGRADVQVYGWRSSHVGEMQ